MELESIGEEDLGHRSFATQKFVESLKDRIKELEDELLEIQEIEE
jgi:hypothetical protein